VAQLIFARDYSVPSRLQSLNYMVDFLTEFLKNNPDKVPTYQNALYGALNSQKVFIGQDKALKDVAMMERKKDFEDNIKAKVNADPKLKAKYENIWNEIESASTEYGKIYNELTGYDITNRSQSRFVSLSKTIVKNTLSGKETKDSLINAVYEKFDSDYNKGLLVYDVQLIYENLGNENEFVKSAFGGSSQSAAVDFIMKNSLTTSKDGAFKLAKMSSEELKSSSDPLIKFLIASKPKLDELTAKRKEIEARIDVNSQMLGQVLYEIYSTSIPPDATLTLRISDGTIKTYSYNGTIAPPNTTFYGLYDRYFSHGKKFPWDLPERWKNRPADFKLETPYNLITTNDIIGGNSGSALINTKAEVVGLVFDGNIESLPGRYIYTTESNRTVAVDSRGLLEAVKNIYKATRLSYEMENGKMLK
jgi:hypothetical protein